MAEDTIKDLEQYNVNKLSLLSYILSIKVYFSLLPVYKNELRDITSYGLTKFHITNIAAVWKIPGMGNQNICW